MMGLEELAQVVLARLYGVFLQVLNPTSRIGLVSLLFGVAFALISYRRSRVREGCAVGLRDFVRFIAPHSVYTHRSALVDLKLFLFAALLRPVQLLVLGASVGLSANYISRLFERALGSRPDLLSNSIISLLCLSVLLLLVYDFSTYVIHRLSHETPVLWAFHRVHHSAEVLTPLTLLRKHPVYDALSRAIDIVLVSPVLGAVMYLWGASCSAAAVAITGAGFALFGYMAGVLRHSHIWLSFGAIGDRLVVSPAMHQIHHSAAPQHWNRNYGEVFAIWDVLFGTAFLPQRRLELVFGLGDGRTQPHPNLVHALIEPVGFALALCRRRAGSVAISQLRSSEDA